MPDSLVGILIALAAVLPGFVITELSMVGRPGGKRSDLEIVLRALFYALIIHLVFGFYTVHVVNDVSTFSEIPDHLLEVSMYVSVVLVFVPLVVGLTLNSYFRRRDRAQNAPGRLYAVLGAHEPGSAGDIFAARTFKGAWLIVETNDGKFVGGKFGPGSVAGQSPDDHDYFIAEEWLVDGTSPNGPVLVGKITPQRGAYIPAASVKSVRVNY